MDNKCPTCGSFPYRKPDAAERAATRCVKELAGLQANPLLDPQLILARILREEIARDNAERDARDREREEAVRRLLGMYMVCTTPGCQCASGSIVIGVRRAFGWDKEGM